MDKKLEIEYVSIDSIKPYESNAKEHPELQIEQIKASMQEFGNIDPIGIWHGEIVEGHGRYMAAKELGYTEVPVIRLDGLTDEQRRAYALVHNQLTMNSGFDMDALEAELASISDIDLDIYQFDMDDVVAGDDSHDDEEDDEEPKEKNLAAYSKVHYMITVDISHHDDIIDLIKQLEAIDGVEVESTINGKE